MNAKNFLLLGLSAIISINAFAAPVQNTENAVEHLAKTVQVLQQQKAIPNVPINLIVKASKDVHSVSSKGKAHIDIHNSSCSVDVEVDTDMNVSYIGSKANREIMKDVTGTSANQDKLRTEYVVLHELAHCKMSEIKDVFQHENTQVQKILNDFFKFSSVSHEDDKIHAGLYYNLHENFADNLAFMQLIKVNGATPEVLELIQKIQIERSESSTHHNKNGLINHNTEFSLKEILKEENIKRILETEDFTQLQDLALKIANKGLWESIGTYTQDISTVINMDTMQNGIVDILSKSLIQDSNEHENISKNVNVNVDDSILYRIAMDVKKELGEKIDISNIQTNDDFDNFYKINKDLIENSIFDKLSAQVNSIDNGNDDVITLLCEKLGPVLKSIKEENKVKTIEQVKKDGMSDLKNINNIAQKLSSENVLNKISQFRRGQDLASSNIKVNIRTTL